MPEKAPASSSLLRCPERDAIIDQIRKVINDIMLIHSEELESVISGNLEPRDAWITHRIEELRELKALLMERLQHHKGEHGC